MSYIFSAAGYHSGNDSAENSKYIWKTYGIKKSFCDLYRQTLFQFNIKFITDINLKMLTYQFYSTQTTNVLYYYLLQSVQTSSYIYICILTAPEASNKCEELPSRCQEKFTSKRRLDGPSILRHCSVSYHKSMIFIIDDVNLSQTCTYICIHDITCIQIVKQLLLGNT